MNKIPFPKGTKTLKRYSLTGIYILIQDDEVVYVGQALNIFSRIHSHILQEEKIFNKVKYLECNKEDLDTQEYHTIKRFLPKYNKRHNDYRSILTRHKDKSSLKRNHNLSIKEYIRIKNL